MHYQVLPSKSRLLLLLLFLSAAAAGQTRRALLVGIDHYIQPVAGKTVALSPSAKARLQQVHGAPSRTSIRDLGGAVNDVRQMRDLLIRKFHLQPVNIKVLINEQATADQVLQNLQRFLIDGAVPGDESLFFYAGHGSRIRNKSTENRSGMDSTIIPADALLGVPDIRSKELARIYARAPEKDVRLTIVQDSCFSGGGARGLLPLGKLRVQEPDSQVYVDEKLTGPKPEEAGVLVLSASQDYQPAQEVDSTDTGPHGAFTWAFLTALDTSGENERVDRIFQRTRALMQSKVNDQEPVIGQLKGRNERGLFGQPADAAALSATTAVGFVNREKRMVELNSGVTLGLHPDCELKRITPASPEVRVRVTEVNGPSSANAAILSGDPASVQVGNLFQLDKWVAPQEEFLKVYTGAGMPFSKLASFLKTSADLRMLPGVEVVSDPGEVTPTHILLWNGKTWRLVENRTGRELLATAEIPSAAQTLDALAHQKEKPRIAVIAPIAAELLAKLAIGAHVKNPAVAVVDSPRLADYALIGRLGAGGVEYAWVRPAETQQDIREEAAQARRDGHPASPPVWPQRSDWVGVSGGSEELEHAAFSLNEQLTDLARIAGWMRLQTPVPDDTFPYQLALRDVETKQTSGTELLGGRQYQVVLRRKAGALKTTSASRRIYVFVIDAFGKGQLIFPKGNLDNEFPFRKNSSGQFEVDDEIEVTKPQEALTVVAPYGIDNYFLLTSAQPIDNAEEVFNFSGVRTRSARVVDDPLARLISDRASGMRGSLSSVPTNWSIERVAFRSVDPARQN